GLWKRQMRSHKAHGTMAVPRAAAPRVAAMRYLYYQISPYLTPDVLLSILAVIVLVGILWVVLPFSVFGIKPLLRSVRDELRTMNTNSAEATAQLRVLIEQQNLLLAEACGRRDAKIGDDTGS
ncbi:MAG: hypothetical protein WBQ57_10800, partial [Rhodanobacteraceae bacterium]